MAPWFPAVIGAISVLGKSNKQTRGEKRQKDLQQEEEMQAKIALQNEQAAASGGKIVGAVGVLDKKEMYRSKMKAVRAKRANAKGGLASASLVCAV